jgi:hypothetical protein
MKNWFRARVRARARARNRKLSLPKSFSMIQNLLQKMLFYWITIVYERFFITSRTKQAQTTAQA